jgi:hypothetical protein
MIFPSNRVRIMVATKPVDFRNYVKRAVMWSPPRLKLLPRFCPIA